VVCACFICDLLVPDETCKADGYDHGQVNVTMSINTVFGTKIKISRVALTALRLLAAAIAIWLMTEIYTLHSIQKIGEDFIVYWPSGRLLLNGQDPYSPNMLYELQKYASTMLGAPLPFYNPPWVLPFILPFSFPDYSLSRLIWVSFNTGVLIFCTGWLWHLYYLQPAARPETRRRAFFKAMIWTVFVAATYVPAFTVIMKGQIVSLVLLGVVGFVHFEKRGQYFLAGMSTILIAIKPHIIYLFWFALLLWILDRRRWSVTLGAGLCFSIMIAIPLLYDPDIFKPIFHHADRAVACIAMVYADHWNLFATMARCGKTLAAICSDWSWVIMVLLLLAKRKALLGLEQTNAHAHHRFINDNILWVVE